jgi:hypothetical protein
VSRPIQEYTLADWKRLRPLTHILKSRRYDLMNRLYVRRAALGGNPLAIARMISGRNVLVTISFNDSEAIRWQTLLIRHYVPRALHIIADNSSDETAAREIMEVSARRALPYLRLPRNPWRSCSRSHGIALNWVWSNVLRLGMPRAFGFIDDDIFPTARDDPFAPLDSQDFYGVIREAGPRWFLWAGYCMFRFDAVKDKPLDFAQDWFAGLDTGGANWNVLYRHVERGALYQPPSAFTPYKAGIAVHEGPLHWCGPWLHEVGSMGNAALAIEKRRAVAQILLPHLTAAGHVPAVG